MKKIFKKFAMDNVVKYILFYFILKVVIMCPIASAVSIDDRPEMNGKPTKVKLGLFVADIDNVSTSDQNFTANIFLLASWHDPRLAHQGKRFISKPLSEIWHPKLQFLNQQRLWKTMKEEVEIMPNGDVIYRQRVWGDFSQPMSLRRFPFDKQTFSIQVVAASFTPDDIQFIADTQSNIARKFSQPDWKILGWKIAVKPYSIPGVKQTAASVSFNMRAERYIGYYIFNYLIPLLLIVCMSFIAFWVDTKNSDLRVSIAVTSMLTLIAYRFIIGTTLPRVSYLTRLDIFILACTLLVFSTLIVTALSSLLEAKNKHYLAKKIDRICHWVFPVILIIISIMPFFFYI